MTAQIEEQKTYSRNKGKEGRSRDRRAATGAGGQQQRQEQPHRHATAVNLIDYRMRYKLGVDVYKTITPF